MSGNLEDFFNDGLAREIASSIIDEEIDVNGIEYECPGCGAMLLLKRGVNSCPECGFSINLEKGEIQG